jgi:hypothetical protein
MRTWLRSKVVAFQSPEWRFRIFGAQGFTLLSSKMVTLTNFREAFLREIEARDFGDPSSLPERDTVNQTSSGTLPAKAFPV